MHAKPSIGRFDLCPSQLLGLYDRGRQSFEELHEESVRNRINKRHARFEIDIPSECVDRSGSHLRRSYELCNRYDNPSGTLGRFSARYFSCCTIIISGPFALLNRMVPQGDTVGKPMVGACSTSHSSFIRVIDQPLLFNQPVRRVCCHESILRTVWLDVLDMVDRTWCTSTPRIYSRDKAVSLDNDVAVHDCYRFPHSQRILDVADLPHASLKRTNNPLRTMPGIPTC